MRISKRMRWGLSITAAVALAAGVAAPIVAQTIGENANGTAGVAAPQVSNARGSDDGASPAAAGNALLDDTLEFTPITPCRVFDSRISGGVLTDNSTRSAVMWAGSSTFFTAQGGNNCGLTSRTRAVHINVTAIGVSAGASPGFLTVYPALATLPNASVLNFTAGQVVANAFTVKICAPPTSCGSADLSIFNAFGTTHVIIDILGYYEPPLAALVNADGTITAGSATAGISASNLGAGYYQVNFPRDVTDCVHVATLGSSAFSSPLGFISTADRSGVATAVFVQTANTAGTQTNEPFTIRLTC